jgi:hypothetical protein
VNRIITLKVPEQDTSQTTPVIDSTSVVKNVDFDLEMSAKVPSTVQAQVKTFVNSNTAFVLKNMYRKEIRSPLDEINGDTQAMTLLKARPADHIILFVQALVYATDLSIKLQNSSGVEGGVDVYKYGNFTFKVHYNCKQQVEQAAAKGGALLWKYAELKFDPATQKMAFDSKAFNLKDYSFMPALQ